MNKVTVTTRRNIFDEIILTKINWSGCLKEPEFLSRIFDLSKLPSHDHRFFNAYDDIYQHRIKNYDWDDGWILSDERLNLLHCNDETFLSFLCEMIHPIVRVEDNEINTLLNIFNKNLFKDKFEIFESKKISGKPIFKWREVS